MTVIDIVSGQTEAPAPSHPAAADPDPAPGNPIAPLVAERELLLRKSGCSGQRGIADLHLILVEHEPVWNIGPQGLELLCSTCRQGGGQRAHTYPCRTTDIAMNALRAMLR